MSRVSIYRRILLFSTLAACIALLASLATPSEAKSAAFLGLSASRLAVSALIFLFGIVFGGVTILAHLQKPWFANQVLILESFLSVGKRSLYVTLSLLLGIVSCAAALLLASGLTGFSIGMLGVGLQRIAALLGLLLGLCLFSLWGVSVYRRDANLPGHIWEPAVLMRFSLFAGLVALTSVHWLTLIFQIPWFSGLKGWYFYYRPQVFGREWFYLVIFLVCALLGYLVIFKLPSRWALAGLVVCAFVLQFGLAYIDQGSFTEIRQAYIYRYDHYAKYVSNHPGLPIPELVRNYESLFAEDNFIGTKPPGMISAYYLIDYFVATHPDQNLRMEQFSGFLTLVLPFLAALVVLPLFVFSRLVLPEEQRLLPALLFVFTPGFALLSFLFDQALYPGLSILFIWLWMLSLWKNSPGLAFLSGIFLYLLAFFSFSFLPLSFFAFLLLIFSYLIFGRSKPAWAGLKTSLWIGLAFLAGLLLLHLVFLILLNYDVLARYTAAMTIHRSVKQYPTGLAELWPTLLINNADFALGIGPAMFGLSLGGLLLALKGSEKKLQWLAWAFLLTFGLLNLAGQTRSETLRLWLYLNPFFAIYASNLLFKWFGRWAIYAVLLLQLLTTCLLLSFHGIYLP